MPSIQEEGVHPAPPIPFETLSRANPCRISSSSTNGDSLHRSRLEDPLTPPPPPSSLSYLRPPPSDLLRRSRSRYRNPSRPNGGRNTHVLKPLLFFTAIFVICYWFVFRFQSGCRLLPGSTALVEELQRPPPTGREEPASRKRWERAFIRCFQQVDDMVRGKVRRSVLVGDDDGSGVCSGLPPDPIALETVGSTTVIAVIFSSHIVIAN